MKKSLLQAAAGLCIGAAAFTAATPAMARNTVHYLPLADVIALGLQDGKLDGSVQFFLNGQATPAVLERLGQDSTNKKTNGVGKTDEFSCQWAALSALIALQNKAKSLGANAVVDILSNYDRKEYASATNYECQVGAIMTGVALKGTYAKVR